MNNRELFKVTGLPVFQNKVFHDHAAALGCPKGDMTLVQNMDSGLIFNASFDPGLLDYDSDYQNEQACSAVFQDHLASVKEIIARHCQGLSLIEVGCGKGYFLEYLLRSGFQITGMDPAYEGDNPHVIKAYFEAGLGLSADAIILRHVLEHMPDPFAFLATIAEANGGKGVIYIEVPCFDWISEHRAWFDVFYEHVNYFRMADFQRLFREVRESGRLFGGQYLYVVADLASLRRPESTQGDVFDLPADFLAAIDRVATAIAGKRNAVWGGASKGVIFSLYMQRAGRNIDLAIDINPAKQNKYMAGTGVKIFPPKEGLELLSPGDTIIVMNSNYFAEIVESSLNRFHYLKVDHHGL